MSHNIDGLRHDVAQFCACSDFLSGLDIQVIDDEPSYFTLRAERGMGVALFHSDLDKNYYQTLYDGVLALYKTLRSDNDCYIDAVH